MIPDWSHQELQFEVLGEQTQRYATTFRWLFVLNLAAAVIGVVMHRYELTAVAAGSSLIALIGVAFARRGRKIVSEATWESRRIRHKLELR